MDEDIADANEYYIQHKDAIDKIIAWADDEEIYVGFGVSGDRTYLCEYEVRKMTKDMCKGFASELKAMLKQEWKHIELGYQQFGYLR